MRARVVVAMLAVLVAACANEPPPPVVEASETRPTPSVTLDPDEARLAQLRATDQFDEFAEHERAAQADGARLAWENFAPIVDGERVEWANKAELWDSIAPKIRDEALLLGPEHREPLWNNAMAVPTSAGVPWTFADTEFADYVEFLATYISELGPTERIWGFLVVRGADGGGEVIAAMPPFDLYEADYSGIAERAEHLRARTWAWIQQGRRA